MLHHHVFRNLGWFREGWYSKFGCTHTGITEPVVWSGVRQVETVFTQQQFIQLEEKEEKRGRKQKRKNVRSEHHIKVKIYRQTFKQAPNLQTKSHCFELKLKPKTTVPRGMCH